MKAFTTFLIISFCHPSFPLRCGEDHFSTQKTDQERMTFISSTLSNVQISNSDKFIRVLDAALAMEGDIATGPDVMFNKTPRWSHYLLVFTDDYKGYAWAPEYKKADLSFLDAWQLRHGPKILTDLLVKLGYFDKRGLPKHRIISKAHREQILQQAIAIYQSAKPAA